MFLDTSGLLCLHSRREPLHRDALALYQSRSDCWTHNFIMVEFVALAHARRLPRLPVLEYVTHLLQNPKIQLIWIDERLTLSGFALLLARQDKTYSL